MKPYYQDDYVTLYHGDCLEVTEWLKADVLVTDPPYGRNWKQRKLAASESREGIRNDHSTEARDKALEAWGKNAICFGDLMLAPPAGNKLTAIYHKASGVDGARGAIAGVRRDAEAIYFIGKWPTGIGGRSSIFRTNLLISSKYGVVAQSGGHPHAKPIGVLEALISLTTGVIADPFAGSGSTLYAAKALGRRAIGVELEERYCEIAARRLSQDVLDLEGAAV